VIQAETEPDRRARWILARLPVELRVPWRAVVGWRRDIHPDPRGLAVPGRAARPVLAAGRGLGHQRGQRPPARPRRAQTCRALATPGARLVHHTDRGSPYASDEYRQALAEGGIVASMSRTGDCYNNAVAESFFATLKAEHVDHEDFAPAPLAPPPSASTSSASTTPPAATRTSVSSPPLRR
jgi:transposase InsO family protein